MTSNNSPSHDPIIAVYTRLIELAQNARRERQRQQTAETAVKPAATAVNGRNQQHDNEHGR